MDPLVQYYPHQAGRGRTDNGLGPLYNNPTFLESGILGGLCRLFVRSLLWQRSKTMSTEALLTRRNIVTDMTDPNAKIRDIVLETYANRCIENKEAEEAGTQS